MPARPTPRNGRYLPAMSVSKALIEQNRSGQIAPAGETEMDDDTDRGAHSMQGARMMLSALDLANQIETGSLEPDRLFDLCAKAIAATGNSASVFVAGETGEPPGSAAGALRGLPIAAKDVFDTAGLPTSYGSQVFAGHRPRTDATVIAQARRAGGRIIGKTATGEFGLEPDIGDPIRQPCGAALAVARGLVPIAIGSQTDEAIIRPAAALGIAGFKPSFKILPTVGLKCVSWHLDTAGLFAAGIADVAFAAAAITGRDWRVDDEAPPGPTIGVISRAGPAADGRQTEQLVEHAADLAGAAGAQVRPVTLPDFFYDAARAHSIIKHYEAYRALAYEYDHHRDQLAPKTRALLDAGATIDTDTYDSTRRSTRRTRLTFSELIKDVDVLISATVGINRLWTLLGCPCVSVPGLFDSDGQPAGIQVIGRFGRDHVVLSAARFLERVFAQAPQHASRRPVGVTI